MPSFNCIELISGDIFDKSGLNIPLNIPQGRSLRKEKTDAIAYIVTCYKQAENDAGFVEINYYAEISLSGRLDDFAMVSARSRASNKDFVVDAAEVLATTAVAALSSSYLARKMIYPGENDKEIHAVAGSIIGSIAAEIAFKIFHLSKDQSLIAGILAGCTFGLLKEYAYDKSRQDRHTVDQRDFYATCGGAFVGDGAMRLLWHWGR